MGQTTKKKKKKSADLLQTVRTEQYKLIDNNMKYNVPDPSKHEQFVLKLNKER